MEHTRCTVRRCHSTKNMSKTFNIVLIRQIFIVFCVAFVYSPSQLTDKQKELLDWSNESARNCSLHVNKAICLLSHHPFGDTFEKWLRFIYVSWILNGDQLSYANALLFHLENVEKCRTFNRSNRTLHNAVDRRGAVSIAQHFNSIVKLIKWTNYTDATGRLADAAQRSRLYAAVNQLRTRQLLTSTFTSFSRTENSHTFA